MYISMHILGFLSAYFSAYQGRPQMKIHGGTALIFINNQTFLLTN
jgi:hypothetical protein